MEAFASCLWRRWDCLANPVSRRQRFCRGCWRHKMMTRWPMNTPIEVKFWTDSAAFSNAEIQHQNTRVCSLCSPLQIVLRTAFSYSKANVSSSSDGHWFQHSKQWWRRQLKTRCSAKMLCCFFVLFCLSDDRNREWEYTWRRLTESNPSGAWTCQVACDEPKLARPAGVIGKPNSRAGESKLTFFFSSGSNSARISCREWTTSDWLHYSLFL